MSDTRYYLTKPQIIELIRAGERLWRASHVEPPEMGDVIMCLLGEAAETLRALQKDRPSGFGSSWPEMAEMAQAAYENAINIERNAAEKAGQPLDPDLYRLPPRNRAKPSAAALQRLLDTMSLLRWVRSRNASLIGARQRMLLALAGGLSPARVAEFFPELGYRNRDAVLAAKKRSLLAIEAAITKIVGKIYLNVAA